MAKRTTQAARITKLEETIERMQREIEWLRVMRPIPVPVCPDTRPYTPYTPTYPGPIWIAPQYMPSLPQWGYDITCSETRQ